jgi:hypothetical protein
MIPPAATPASRRQISNWSIVLAVAVPTVAAAVAARSINNTGRRPTRSDNGPYTSVVTAYANIYAGTNNPTRASVVPNATFNDGINGANKYD